MKPFTGPGKYPRLEFYLGRISINISGTVLITINLVKTVSKQFQLINCDILLTTASREKYRKCVMHYIMILLHNQIFRN